LVELPARQETEDNMVLSWRPAEPLAPGGDHRFRYDLAFGTDPAPPSPLAKVALARSGAGGAPGRRRFVVAYAGDAAQLADARPEVSASAGVVGDVVLQPGEAPGVVRISFVFD